MNYKQGKINQQPVLEITGKQQLEVHGSSTIRKSPLSLKSIAAYNRPVSKINLSIPSPQPSEVFRKGQFNADIRMHYATTYNQQQTEQIKKPNLNKFANGDYSLIYPRKSQIIESQDENNQKVSKNSKRKEGLEIKLFEHHSNDIYAQDSERIVLSLNAQEMLDLNHPNQYSKSKNSIILIGSSQYERRRSQNETVNDKKSIYKINQENFKNSKYELHLKQERDYDQNTLSALNQYDSANRIIQKIDSKNKKNWRKSGMFDNKQKDGGDNVASNKSSINISMNEINHLNQAMMLEANSKRDLLQTGTSQDLYNTQYFMNENLLKLASKSLRQKEKRIEKNIAVVNLNYDQIQKVVDLSSSPKTNGQFKNQFFQKYKNANNSNRHINSFDPNDIIIGKKIQYKNINIYQQIDSNKQEKQLYLAKQRNTYQSPSGNNSDINQFSQIESDPFNKKNIKSKNESGYVNFQMNSQQNGGDIYRSIIKTKTFHMDSGKFSPIASDESVESLVQRQNSGLSKKRSNLNIQNSLSNSKQSKKQMKKYQKIQNSQQKLNSQINLQQVQNLDESIYIKKIEQNVDIYKVKIQNIEVQNEKRYIQENRVETSQDLSLQKQQEIIHSVQIPQVDKLKEKSEFKFGLEEVAQNTEQPKSRNSSLALSRKTSSQNSQKQINQLKESEQLLQQSKSQDNQFTKNEDVHFQQQISVAALNQLQQDQIRRQQMQQFISENQQLPVASKNPFDESKINDLQKMNSEGIQPILFDHNEAFMSTIKFLEDSFQLQPNEDLQNNETLMKNFMNQQNYKMLLAAQNPSSQQIIQSYGADKNQQFPINSPLGQLIDNAILNLDLNITSNRFNQRNQKGLQNKKSKQYLKSLNQTQIKDIQITRRNSTLETLSPNNSKNDSPIQNQKDIIIERKPLQMKEFEFFKNKNSKKPKLEIQKQNEVDLVQTGMDADSYQNIYSQIQPNKNQSQSFLFQPQSKKEQELANDKFQNQQNIMIGGNSVQQLIGFSQNKNQIIQEQKNQNSDTLQSQNYLEIQNENKNQQVDLNDMSLKQILKDPEDLKLTEQLEIFLQKAQINENVIAEHSDSKIIKEEIQQDSHPNLNQEIPIQMALNKFDMTRNIFLDSLIKNLDFINQLKSYNEKEVILNKECLINNALPFRMCHYKFDDKNQNYKKYSKNQMQNQQQTNEINKNFLNQSSESSFPLLNKNSQNMQQNIKLGNKNKIELSLGSIEKDIGEKSLIEGVAIVNNKGINMYSNRDFKTLPNINNSIDKKQMIINLEKEDFLMNLRKNNQTISPQINELLPFNCSIKGELAIQSKYKDQNNQQPKKQIISRNIRIKTNFSSKNSSLNGMKKSIRGSKNQNDSTTKFEEQNDFIEQQKQQQLLIRKPDKFIHNVSLFQPSYLIRDKFKKQKDPLLKVMMKNESQQIESGSPRYISEKLRQKSMIHSSEQFESQKLSQLASQHPFNSLQSKRKGGLQQLFMQSLMFPSAFDIYKQSIILQQDSNKLVKDSSSKNHFKMTESFLDKLQKGDSRILNDNNGSPLTEVLGQSVFDINDSTPQPQIQKSESLNGLKTQKNYIQSSSGQAYHQIFEQKETINKISGLLNQESIHKNKISNMIPFNEDSLLNNNLLNQLQISGNKNQNYQNKEQQVNKHNEQSIISNFKMNFQKENNRYNNVTQTQQQINQIQNLQMQNTITQRLHTSTHAQFSQNSKQRKPSIDIENKLQILQDTILDTLEKTEQYNEKQLRKQEHQRIKMISLGSFGSNEASKVKVAKNKLNKSKIKINKNYQSDGSSYSSPDVENHIKRDYSIINKTQIFQRTFENSVGLRNFKKYDLKTIQDEDATMMRVKIIDMKKKDLKTSFESKLDKDKQLVQILIRRTAEGQELKEFELQQQSPNEQTQIEDVSVERKKNITTRQLNKRDNTGTLESPSIEILKSSIQKSVNDLSIIDGKRDYIYVHKDSLSQKSKRRIIQDVQKIKLDASDQDIRFDSQNNINELFQSNLQKTNNSKQFLQKPIINTKRSLDRQSDPNEEMSQTYLKSSLNEYEKISQSQQQQIQQLKKNKKKQIKKYQIEDFQIDEEKFRKSIKLQKSFVSKTSKNQKHIPNANDDVQSRSFQLSYDEASHFSNNSNHAYINSNYSKSMIGKQKEEFINSKLSMYKNNMTSKEIIDKGDKKRVKVYEDNMKADDSREALKILKKNKLKTKKKEDSLKSPSKLQNYQKLDGSHLSAKQSKKTLMRQGSLRSSVSGYGDSPLNISQQKIRKIAESRIRAMNQTNALFQSNQNNYYSQVRQMNYTQGQIDQKINGSYIKPLQQDIQVKIVSKKYDQKNNSPLQPYSKQKLNLNGKLIIDGNNNGQLDRLLQNMLSQSNSKYSNVYGSIDRKGKKNNLQGRLAKQGPLANRGGQVDLNKSDEKINFNIQAQFNQNLENDLELGKMKSKEFIITKGMKLYENNQSLKAKESKEINLPKIYQKIKEN